MMQHVKGLLISHIFTTLKRNRKTRKDFREARKFLKMSRSLFFIFSGAFISPRALRLPSRALRLK